MQCGTQSHNNVLCLCGASVTAAAASRRVSMNSKALSTPPGNKTALFVCGALHPATKAFRVPSLCPLRLFPSHYFTLKYIPVFCITDMMQSGCRSPLLSGAVGDRMRWGPWQARRRAADVARFRAPALSSKAVCLLCVAATPDFVFALKFPVIKCTKSIWCISLQSIINEHFQIWASSTKKRKKNALRHQTTFFWSFFIPLTSPLFTPRPPISIFLTCTHQLLKIKGSSCEAYGRALHSCFL